MAMGRQLILLDRDGVLNEDRPDHVKNPDELIMIAGSADAVARLNAAGRQVVVVTNQSAVGRQLIDEEMLKRIHAKLCAAVADAGGKIERIFWCADPPWAATSRRKPGPDMLLEALDAFDAAAVNSPMIGDSLRDLEAAAAAGCPRILVRTGKGAKTLAVEIPRELSPVLIKHDLSDAVDSLLEAGA
jgi:D-glycero-D-manno-heptose 1,7-bisphosphate phosphatase